MTTQLLIILITGGGLVLTWLNSVIVFRSRASVKKMETKVRALSEENDNLYKRILELEDNVGAIKNTPVIRLSLKSA